MNTETPEPVIAKPLTPKEVEEALGVGQTTVYKLLSTGALRSFKVGKSRRIPRQEVERFIAAQMQQDTAAS